MADRSKEYLTWHFHDFVCVDWQYSREKQRLRIHIRENWDRDENSDAFCLEFEGIRYYAMEAESRHPISPLFWIISTVFTQSARKDRLEKLFGEPLLQYEIELDGGYAQIICTDIHAKRLKEDPPPCITAQSWTPPPPPEQFLPEEREERILAAAQNHRYPSKDYDRGEETLRQMEENDDPDLLPIVRGILKLDKPNFWDIAVRLLGKYGTPEDLPLLYAHLPGTKNRPDLRRALLDAIDALGERQ